ncbi:hypothetical protein AEAC466_17390 [Asticcacaulis sp. AC466]|uniref:hypothetical protein n=1 Tax=Asticcacaulis sp. AC466 TaxID=1282362 RepID=UPI0003C3D9B7|nr:hypothetical protein [Asticcacaulis sp. AC466]ESQ82397.1 hypothetical protein AEAC466_17390 [Asticcacaulis sp. AC466]
MYQFPYSLFGAKAFQPWLANTRVSGGNTLNGVGQEADWSGGGYWCFELSEIRVSTDAQHLEWCGLCTEIGDGFTTVEVPVVAGFPMPVGTATPDTMAFKANAAANLAATSIDIKVMTGDAPARGHKMTINHPLAGARLYSIFSSTALGSGVYRCKIRPPLREAVAANTVIDFKNLRLVMKVKSTAKDIWPKLMPPYKARPQILFIEDFSYQNAL